MAIKKQYCNPEIWGGIECTINRVGDDFRDQLGDAGFYQRNDDIERIAQLGIKVLRFPLLWERHQPIKDAPIDWQWADAQLSKITAHGIKPVAGLLHHGSGPAFTNLYADDFPELLAAYAKQVATRFPWLEYYTPVNEPLTTARFSGLYGLWYPHHRNAQSFLRMLINEVKGIVLSMRAIRKINPSAKLIQTEDLAKVHGTTRLQYQCDFENERRWLTYDLLCGKLNRKHAMWDHFIENGIPKESLDFFLKNPCPPDIAGFNYYVTSERFLDEKTRLHPPHTHGGNGKHNYADVEAVRVMQPAGVRSLLQEAWNRYHLPLALTEVHLGCTREEQMRWFKETWEACCLCTQQGIDIRGVTAWSLLGSHDWNSLLTHHAHCYESGAFDVRNNRLRKTGVANLVTGIAKNGTFHHPVLDEKGWWHRLRDKPGTAQPKSSRGQSPPLLIIGKSGTLGNAFARICTQRGIHHRCLSRAELNILEPQAITELMEAVRPWAVINAAGYVKVDEAENDCSTCFAVNTMAPAFLSKACATYGSRFMTFSSDLVFSGDKHSPYMETDNVQPLNVYGSSKAQGEQKVLANHPGSLIIRTSAFFGPWDKSNFAWHILDTLENKKDCRVPEEVVVSPTYVPDLVNASLDILIDEEHGVWHISNEGNTTWADFAREVAERGGHSPAKLTTCSPREMGWKAQRPVYSALQSGKGIQLPSFGNAMERYFHEKVF